MAGNSAEVILLAASPPHHSLFPSGEGVTDLLREFLRWNEYVCFRPFWALVWFGFVSFRFCFLELPAARTREFQSALLAKI